MAEAVATILTSPNALICIGGVIAIIILLGWFSKKGIVSFKGKGLTVGNTNEEELAIVRTQIQWAEADCRNMLRELMNNLPEGTSMNDYKAKYTIERVLDELVKIIIFNHITLEPTYIKLKQDLVWSVVSSINPEPLWDNLEDVVKARVEVAIRTLYETRQYYNKSK